MNALNASLKRLSPESSDTGRSPLLSQAEALYQALEHMGTNVLIADADLNLVFMNKRSTETLNAIGDVVRQELKMEVEDMVGDPSTAFIWSGLQEAGSQNPRQPSEFSLSHHDISRCQASGSERQRSQL